MPILPTGNFTCGRLADIYLVTRKFNIKTTILCQPQVIGKEHPPVQFVFVLHVMLIGSKRAAFPFAMR